MTSVTAVPLRPIAKGSISRLWFGVALLVLAAIALAWIGKVKVETLGFTVVKEGTGPSPAKDDVVLISYVGKLEDGKVFDQSEQAPLGVDQVVPGFSQALQRMKKGGEYHISIPPKLGYGSEARGPIPANSTLKFDVKLLDFKSKAEIERLQKEMQNLQLMDAQGKLPPGMGGPGGPAGAAPPLPTGEAPAPSAPPAEMAPPEGQPGAPTPGQ